MITACKLRSFHVQLGSQDGTVQGVPLCRSLVHSRFRGLCIVSTLRLAFFSASPSPPRAMPYLRFSFHVVVAALRCVAVRCPFTCQQWPATAGFNDGDRTERYSQVVEF